MIGIHPPLYYYGFQTLYFPNEIVSGFSKLRHLRPGDREHAVCIFSAHEFQAPSMHNCLWAVRGVDKPRTPRKQPSTVQRKRLRTTHTANRDVCLRAANHASLCCRQQRNVLGLNQSQATPTQPTKETTQLRLIPLFLHFWRSLWRGRTSVLRLSQLISNFSNQHG